MALGAIATLRLVLDTGFNDCLTLPRSVIDELKLTYVDAAECELADGRVVSLESYLAEVDWQGSTRQVLALAADGDPLLGMSLLAGPRVTVEVIAEGTLKIEPIA